MTWPTVESILKREAEERAERRRRRRKERSRATVRPEKLTDDAILEKYRDLTDDAESETMRKSSGSG